MTQPLKTLELLQSEVNKAIAENVKFLADGNNAAGTRARKALAEIMKLAKQARVEIQAVKSAAA